MLLNRESNPGLPRLVVSNHMTTGGLLVIVPWDLWIRSDAYAEIIATRPLGIVTNSNSLMVVFHGYLPLAKYLEIRIRAGLCQSTSSWLTSKVPSWRDLLVTKIVDPTSMFTRSLSFRLALFVQLIDLDAMPGRDGNTPKVLSSLGYTYTVNTGRA